MKRIFITWAFFVMSFLSVSIANAGVLAADSTGGDTTNIVYGCMDPSASNYDMYATVDNGTCLVDTSNSATMYQGCMDPGALNYDSMATSPSVCYYDTTSGGGDTSNVVYGCMDPNASNYNMYATENNGACHYDTIHACMDVNAINYNPDATHHLQAVCQYDTTNGGGDTTMYQGCMDPGALNYDSMATSPAVCYYDTTNGGGDTVSYIYGCTNMDALNYDPAANMDNGTCKFGVVGDVYGCTYYWAENYNELATLDNGSCYYSQEHLDTASSIPGCMSMNALNYNEKATEDNGGCVYSQDTVKQSIVIPETIVIVDTISSETVESCDVDFTLLIDSAVIVNASLINTSSVEVLWRVFQRGSSSDVSYTYTEFSPKGDILIYLTISNCTGGTLRTATASQTRTVRGVLRTDVVLTSKELVEVDANRVYPNPFTNKVNVASMTEGSISVFVRDLNGEVVLSESVESFSGDFGLQTEVLEKGIYMITLENDNGVLLTEKIVKQ